DRFGIRAELRHAIRTEARESHFDQTHPAITGRTELLVVTVARDENTDLRARLDHACALGKLMPCAINLDIDHWGTRIRHIYGKQERRQSLIIVVRSLRSLPLDELASSSQPLK